MQAGYAMLDVIQQEIGRVEDDVARTSREAELLLSLLTGMPTTMMRQTTIFFERRDELFGRLHELDARLNALTDTRALLQRLARAQTRILVSSASVEAVRVLQGDS